MKNIILNVIVTILIVIFYDSMFDEEIECQDSPNSTLNKLMIKSTLYDLEFHKLEIELTQYEIDRYKTLNKFQVNTLNRYKQMNEVIAIKEIFQIENEIEKTKIDLFAAEKKLAYLKKIDMQLDKIEKDLDNQSSTSPQFIKKKRIRFHKPNE